ncbi:hypothetical protein MRX96_026872 [Rhipicephalus microplus]
MLPSFLDLPVPHHRREWSRLALATGTAWPAKPKQTARVASPERQPRSTLRPSLQPLRCCFHMMRGGSSPILHLTSISAHARWWGRKHRGRDGHCREGWYIGASGRRAAPACTKCRARPFAYTYTGKRTARVLSARARRSGRARGEGDPIAFRVGEPRAAHVPASGSAGRRRRPCGFLPVHPVAAAADIACRAPSTPLFARHPIDAREKRPTPVSRGHRRRARAIERRAWTLAAPIAYRFHSLATRTPKVLPI